MFADIDIKTNSLYETMMKTANIYSDLVKGIELRSARVRIANGAFLNFAIAALVIPLYFAIDSKWVVFFVSFFNFANVFNISQIFRILLSL